MSITALPPASSTGRERKPDGVRTYRGKSLAELIPQIRAELGPDAIILREREGLIGGVSGFFAKRCIEIDARGAAPRIDVYDDDDDDDDTPDAAPEAIAGKDEDQTGSQDGPKAQAARQRRAEVARRATEARQRRAQAARSTREFDPADERVPEPVEPAARDELGAGHELAAPVDLTTTVAEVTPATEVAAPEVTASTEVAAPELPTSTEVARSELDTVIADQQSFAEQLLAAQVDPEPDPAEPAAAPAPAPVPVAAVEPTVPAPAPAPATQAAPSPRRTARMLTMPGHRAKRAQKFDAGQAAAIGRELVGQGISHAQAARLVSEAAAHSSPFAPQGGLREAVRRALTNSLPLAVTPPAHGAAVAVVGAGGAGKTVSAAALSAAYGRASTLSVTAVSLGDADHGRALKALLKPERVEVKFADGATKAVVQRMRNRSGAMIVVDTVAATPGNPTAVLALADELGALGLDGIYVAVPATLGAQAARQLLEWVAPLSPTGIVVTHADETDQLGVAVELSSCTGIPVAYVLDGVDLAQALSAPHPVDLANRLLP